MIKLTQEQTDRFLSKIDKSGDCWEWTASTFKTGYGAFGLNGKIMYAHRVSYIVHKGDIVNGVIMHTCDNRKCLNPDHLIDGTHKLNAHDMINKGRQFSRFRGVTHCVNGHALDSDNVWIRGKSTRQCKTCSKENQKRNKFYRKILEASLAIFNHPYKTNL